MRTNGKNTVDVCRQLVPNLIVVPALFDPPKVGWIKWSIMMADILQAQSLASYVNNNKGDIEPQRWQKYLDLAMDHIEFSDTGSKEVGEDTISGRLIAGTGPAWRYGMVLPTVLTGDYESIVAEELRQGASPQLLNRIEEIMHAETLEDLILLEGSLEAEPYSQPVQQLRRIITAKSCRMRFEKGDPLYVGIYNSEERYRHVVPVFAYHGDDKYSVGYGKQQQKFRAPNHIFALDRAREWFLEQRDNEIKGAKDAARDIALKGTPQFVYDMFVALIKTDRFLFDEDGTRIAWENGAHGLYGFQGPDWCYITRCSAEKAVQMAMAAQKQATASGDTSMLLVRVQDRVPECLGFHDVQEENGGYRWQNQLVSAWVPSGDPASGKGRALNPEGAPMFLTHVEQSQDGGKSRKYSHRVTIVGPGKKQMASSVIPARWGVSGKDALFWGIRAGINEVQREMRRNRG